MSAPEGRTDAGGRRYPARPFLAASIAVIRRDTVLLAARGKAPMAGIFSLPGGLVEPGETLAAAALREVREETGVVAAIGGLIGPVEVIERDAAGRIEHHVVVLAHWGRWLSGEAACGPEALEICWLLETDLPRLNAPGGLRTTPRLPEILRCAFAFHNAAGTGDIRTTELTSS